MMEPTANLSTAYAKCNGLTLPSDTKNTSSFSFAALEWANNMFQSWTADPQTSTVAGGNNGILTNPSKTTAGRKKAVLLVVNKPDTFTAGELTYLGLSNDADETVLVADWKQTNLQFSQSWSSVCYGGGKFVAVGEGYGISSCSSDGATWSKSTLLSQDLAVCWMSVCYGNGKFVAISSAGYETAGNVAAYSSDGSTWTQSTLPSSPWWSSVCYGGDKFVAVAEGSNEAAYSSNGTSWTQFTMPSSQSWSSVCYGGAKFVAVARSSNVGAYSSNGTSWTQFTLPSSQNWKSVCYGGGKFVAVAEGSDKAAYSSNGINWTQSTMPSSQQWSSVCYGDGKFVALSGVIQDPFSGLEDVGAYSGDGITWTRFNMPSKQAWASVCYGGDKFVTVAGTYVWPGDYFRNIGAYVYKTLSKVKTDAVGNKALKDALGNGASSSVTTLTTNACNKLKQTYGSDIRIYLVKYRKSAGTYTYLDTCATSTSGKIYDVDDSATLKSTLDTIATDLKSWAGYTEAQVVN